MTGVVLKDIRKSYGQVQVLHGTGDGFDFFLVGMARDPSGL